MLLEHWSKFDLWNDSNFSMIYFTDIIKSGAMRYRNHVFRGKDQDAFIDLSWEWLLIIQEAVLANLYRGW